MSAVAAPPPTEPESGVIEEARTRQRRHRLLAATGLTLVLGLGGALASRGGGGPSTRGGPGGGPPLGAGRLDGRARSSCAAVYGKNLEGVPSRSLLSILGVLRRPPTRADRLPPSMGPTGDPFVRFVRRTRVIEGRAYYLYPTLSGCRPGHEALADLTANVDLGGGTIGGVGGGGGAAAQIENGEYVSTGPPESATSSTITMVVPDGVAGVTLRYPAGRASGYSPKVSPPFSVSAAPVGNEVVVRVPRSAGGGPISRPTVMIWHGRGGRVFRTFHRL